MMAILRFSLELPIRKDMPPNLQQRAVFPPPGEGTPRPPMLHIELEALVRALRDAEVLAFGAISAAQVRRRIDMSDR